MRFMFSLAAVFALSATLLLLAGCNPAAFDGQTNANTAPTATTAPTTTTNVPNAPPAPPQPTDGVRRITVAELQQELAANKALVVDVRGDGAYKAGHIKGSIMIPAAEIDQHVNELPKDKLIVTYCS